MITKFSEECAAVAFYGIRPNAEAAERFYSAVVEWAYQHGCPPDKLSVHGPGYSGKAVSFARPNAILQKKGFEDVTGFSVFSLTPDGKIPVMDFMLTGDYSASNQFAGIAARSSISSLSHADMLPLVRILIQAIKPEYGIGYNRHIDKGPLFYALGMGQGSTVSRSQGSPEQLVDSDNIWAWQFGWKEEFWNSGQIREIYSWNFLNETQLNAPVGKCTLREWIREDAKR